MEGQHREQTAESSGAGSDNHVAPASIPIPVELVDLERRKILPPTQIDILMLRRFADPRTGEWETSTKSIAEFLVIGRSTAQKVLRKLEQQQYLHIRDHRGRTVRRSLHFGGFPQPLHRKLGLPSLRWDSDFTESETRRELSTPVENSANGRNCGLPRRNTVGTGRSFGTAGPTVDHTNNEPTNDESTNSNVDQVYLLNERNEQNERRPDELLRTEPADDRPGPVRWTRVSDFQPRNEDESIVHALAAGLNERFINSFLAFYHRYGLPKLQRACGFAHAKLRDRRHPLRQRPGAYVGWLLNNGKC